MNSDPKRVAIYARYSSDLQNPRSVDDQVALCKEFVRCQFGLVPESALVFSDAAVSGATMERPGIQRLLTAVKARQIDLLIAEGLDRLSRSLKDIAELHETLSYHGVVIWTSHEGQISELHIGLKGTMNALFLRDMKAKVRRGHRARVTAGYAVSSCAYGYRVVRGVVEQGRYVNGVREIDPDAADVIRRVYREFIEGKSIPDIVQGLNEDNIPAPSGGLWKRNALMGGIKKQEGILRNAIYLGRLIHNRHHVVRDPVTNKKRYIPNPENDWLRVDVPHLRIVSDEDWDMVRQLDCPRPQKTRKKPSQLSSHNQHALTGWVKCGWCGGSKSLANAGRYLCSTHRYARKCANSRGTKEPALMDAVFRRLKSRITDGPNFRQNFQTAFDLELKRQDDLVKQIADINARIQRLLDAIERGVDEANVTNRVIALQEELEAAKHQSRDNLTIDIPTERAIRAQLLQAVEKVEATGDVIATRRLFQCVLKEIILTPLADKPRGETTEIHLREDGWPELWFMMIQEDTGK